MHWIVILQIIASIIYVAYLIYKYSLPKVSLIVKISVYFTWLICFSNVVFLPYDVYYSLASNYELSIVWKVSYGLIFFLTWFLLPIAQEYEEAGQFSIKDKLKRAILNNLIIYGIFAAVGVVGFAYFILFKKVEMNNLVSVLIGASNAFGMFLVVIFMSHGLTAIPRQLWRNKNRRVQLKKFQFDASNLIKKKSSTLQELELRVKQILWKVQQEGQNIYTSQVLNLIPKQHLTKWSNKIPDLGKVDQIKAHKDIKSLVLQLNRLQSRWETLTISAFKLEDIQNHSQSLSKRINSTIFLQYKYEILNYLQWFWYCRVVGVIVPLIAVLLVVLAVIIVVAEIAVFIPMVGFLNIFNNLTRIKQFVWLDLVQLLVLGYMAFCIYYAMFKLKLSSFYGLYWNQQTDTASLIFFAINCSRITNPLNYNFLQIINESNTSFVHVTGETPILGQSLKIVFPILIIVLTIFNLFDVYSRICRRLGLKRFQFEAEFSHENIQEGRKLLQKARTDLQTKILNSNCKNLQQFRSYKQEFLDSFKHGYSEHDCEQQRQLFI